MNSKKTFLLAVILGLGVLYLTRVMLPKREFEAGQKLAFSKLDPADIKTIQVTRLAPDGSGEQSYIVAHARQQKGGEPHAGEKREGNSGEWSIPSIRGAVVDAAAANQMASSLRDLSVEGPLSEKDLYSDLSVYGLAKPDMTLVVDEVDSKRTEVAFGKKNEYLAKRYVKVSGRSGVYLVDDTAFEALNKGLSDIRSKTPFGFNVSDVREILLTSNLGRIKISQPAVGEWKILEPMDTRASPEDVRAFLSTIQGLTVSEFIDNKMDERGRYGFGLPRANVILSFREGIEPQQVSLSLANSNAKTGGPAEMFLSSSAADTIFKLAADPSEHLVKQVDYFRFKQLVEIAPSSMEQVVSGGSADGPVTIAASGVAWTINGKASDPSFVDQLLNDISGLKAVVFPANVPSDAFTNPFLTLAITKRGEPTEVVQVTVGKEFSLPGSDQVFRYAKNSLSETVYGIRDVEAKRVVPHEEALVPPPTPTPISSPAQSS
jgi:hypothetical protein